MSRAFWIRAVALQLLLLGLWWSVLFQPSLSLLRVTAQVALGLLTARQDRSPLEVDASGEWKFSIPVRTYVQHPKEGGGPVSVNAVDIASSPDNVAPFSTAWFVYLALALTVPITRASLRRTAIGLGIQTIVSGLALFAYAEINALGIVANMHATPSEVQLWLIKLAYHIDYLVVPYASPFLVILGTHPAWWSMLTAPTSLSQSPRAPQFIMGESLYGRRSAERKPPGR